MSSSGIGASARALIRMMSSWTPAAAAYVYGRRVASCSVSERSDVLAVLANGDVGPVITCAECYDGSCGGKVGYLHASVKV